MAWHGKVRPGLLLFILYSFAVISGTAAKSLEPFRYDTAYACEGKTLKIECKEGELIKLIRANYGRFSITICNDHGNTDWSVNCMAPKSLRVLHERCTDHQNCSIPASTSMFGDPCQGTHKYLEAHYQCQPATTTTTTSRPSPPWLITSQPPMWTTVKSSAARPPPTSKTATVHQHQGGVAGVTQPRPPPSTAASLPTASAAAPPAKRPPPPVAPASDESVEENNRDGQVERGDVDVQIGNIPDEITTLPYTTINPKKTLGSGDSGDPSQYVPSSPGWPVEPLEEHCPPVTVRGIHWNWTRVSQTSIQTCPGGTTGFARWRCSNTTIGIAWSPSTPDLSECRSVWLTSLEQRVKAGKDPLVQITNELAQVTSRKTLYGGDMMITTKIIQRMAQKMSQDIETFSDRRQREVLVTEMLNYVVKTGSNLLDPSQHPSWKDLSFKEQMRVATSLLIGLEENAFLLADTITKEKTVDQIYKNIMLSVRVLETKSVTTETFPSDNTWLASNDSVEIPKGALIENSDGELVRLVFVAFDRLEEILQWHPDVSDPSSNKSVPRILNSKVISASLGKGRHIQLREPVRLTLQHLKTENVSNPSCVFWDYTTSKWSEEGCHVAHTSYTHTICLCDHLTNFAILMDVHEIDLPIQHEIALQIITYIGCSVSIFCLALAILTFQLFRGLKSDHRVTIHCNLCICLLVAELLFLAGIEQTENRIVCGVIAGFLQYFFLCAFGWMFFEGFQLYVMLIEVFEAEKSRIRWYYGFAYGLPLFVVVLSASVYPQGYGTDKYCWLQIDNYFIYTFVVPVLIVIILNLFFLIMAIVMMCRHASATVSMKNKEHSRLASTSGKEENALQEKLQAHLTWLRGAVVLVILLGLTWTFGFLYLDKETVVMAYLFCILNSLQGFFIFLFHCVQNEKVRKEYMKFIQKHSWLPKCLRCSKHAGGPAGSSGSSGLSKDRRTNLFAGSNGNGPSSSNSHSHSTDQSVLSPHGTSLQRGWSSRSCSNVSRVGAPGAGTGAGRRSPPVPVGAAMAATLCHPSRAATTVTPPPSPNLNIDPPVPVSNTSTLPHVRNLYRNGPVAHNNDPPTLTNPLSCGGHIPKSVSTWGPLHKPPMHWKNISFKSHSRDSGHGGSEQEESPRSHATLADARLNSAAKDLRRQAYMTAEALSSGQASLQPVSYTDYIHRHIDSIPHPKHLQLSQSLQTGHRKKNSTGKPNWNQHTYTEIEEGILSRGPHLHAEDDPVYEEIERNEIQVSDMSDEDGKRQSDMSRQSSRSYGDHRPLIPYSPGAGERGLNGRYGGHVPSAADLDNVYRGMAIGMRYRGDTARSLAAVLDVDGETVVCHLEPTCPSELYQHEPQYVSRTMVLPPYSES